MTQTEQLRLNNIESRLADAERRIGDAESLGVRIRRMETVLTTMEEVLANMITKRPRARIQSWYDRLLSSVRSRLSR